MNTNSNKIRKNKVLDRFLPVPDSVLKGLEPEPKITDFTLIKEIGVGSFGRVLLAQHNVTQAQYAIKAIDKRIKDNIEEKPYFRREMEIMYKIHHPNIVKLFGHFEDNTYCYFVMEYISRGNLYSFCPKNGVPLITTQTAVSLIKDIISALYYLHHMNPPIVHRDIKPENILVNEQMRAKLSDFGWSNYLSGNYKRTTICGTPIYLAPEIIYNIGHDEKIDIWCVGVLMFELLTGQAPWKGEDVTTVKNNISKLNINWPKIMDKDAKDLISKILKYMPEERPSLRDILMHPFFTKFYPDAVNCLQAPSFYGNRSYLISKDHPLTYNGGYDTSTVVTDLLSPIATIPFNPSITPSNYNSLKFSSIPEINYARNTEIYASTPLNIIPKTEFTNNISLVPSISNELVETDNNPTRTTYTVTKLNDSFIQHEYPIRTTYTVGKLNNSLVQPDYPIRTTYTVTKLNSSLVQPEYPTRTTYTVGKLNDIFTQPDLIPIRTTYAGPKLDNSLTQPDYPIRTTYAVPKIDNSLTQSNYNIINSNGYSTSYGIKDLTENEERIKELVRRTEIGGQRNYTNYAFQNLFDNNIKSNTRPLIYQTQYRTQRPAYYSAKNLTTYNNLFNSISNTNIGLLNGSINNNKLDYSLANNRLSNINSINLGDINSFRAMNDPDIIKIRENEMLRRESERIKLNSLMKKYGMDLKPSDKTKYNFI